MIVSEIGAFHRLRDERPQLQRFVRSLMVENKIKGRNVSGLLDKEESAQEFLGDGERSLPNLRFAYLPQNPLQNVRHLKSIGEIGLVRTFREWL